MLEIRNLSAFYGRVEALRALDMDVMSGSITTIIGANGAGKSTLLRAISGLIPTRHGSISFFGKDITNMPADRIVGMGISQVPEGRQVFGPLSVLENLKLGAFKRASKTSSAELEGDLGKVYDLFPILAERSGQAAGTLSGGEQQMLAIGRALMAKPRLLLLDEPSMGLAPKIIQEIFRVLEDLHAGGLTILLVEQDAKIALKMSDYGYVLKAGKVALEGESGKLLQDEQVQKIYLGA